MMHERAKKLAVSEGRQDFSIAMGNRRKKAREQRVAQFEQSINEAMFASSFTAFLLGVKDELMIDTRGAPAAAFARQLAIYLLHTGLGYSLTVVALAFGRDRSTIAHSCHLIEDRRDNPEFDQCLDDACELLLQIRALGERLQALDDAANFFNQTGKRKKTHGKRCK